MNERPCHHPFSPCDGPCTSFLYRAQAISARERREMQRFNVLHFSALTFTFIVLFAGVGIGAIAITNQAASNWKAVIAAEARP